MIDFLDESGNFKQKSFYTSKCNFFYISQQRTQKFYEFIYVKNYFVYSPIRCMMYVLYKGPDFNVF